MTLQLDPVQVRTRPLTNYEDAFAEVLEKIFGSGVHDLAGVAAALNETGIRPFDGANWSPDSLRAEFARLAVES